MITEKAEALVRQNVEDVVDALAAVSDPLPRVMLVGAVCRDALHLEHGHTTALRSTDDLDLALVVDGLDQFDQITSQLRRTPSAAGTVRYVIAGTAVDLVPFGQQVEDPDGTVTPREEMSVFGFQDVIASARSVSLRQNRHVLVPTAAGYTVLKLKAWADRSAVGQYKDAPDLAAAMYWYQNDPSTIDRLYSDDADSLSHLMSADWDQDLAAIRLLIADALDLLTPTRRSELKDVWTHLPGGDDLLAAQLANRALSAWPSGQEAHPRRLEYAAAVRAVITER